MRQGFIKALLLVMCLPCLNFNTVNVLGACHVDVALSKQKCERLQVVRILSLRSFA